MNNKIKNLHFYQAANQTDKEIKEHFVVRQNEYQRIISEIKRDDMKGSIQHYILNGRRGSGKSTILRIIQAEINTDRTLKRQLIVIYLSEEQAGVYKLYDLWNLIIQKLQVNGFDMTIPDWSDFQNDLTEYSKSLYLCIQKALKKEKKKLVLLLDNIDRIFDNIDNDAHLLRELLTNYKDLRIIGASTRLSEHYWKYEQPFYQFFRMIKLDSLTNKEVKELLQHWGEYLNSPEIIQFIKKHPGKIELFPVN